MKTNFLRAALVASLSLFVAGTVCAPVSVAAETSTAPKLSRDVSKPLSAAQKALEAKDWATAIAKCKEAQAISSLTDYDKFMINYMLGLGYFNSGDKASATTAFLDATQSTTAPKDQYANVVRIALKLEADATNYDKVIELGEKATKSGPFDREVADILSIAYYNKNDCVNAQATVSKAIAAAQAEGKIAMRGTYQVQLMCQNKAKDVPAVTKTLEAMANLFSEPEDWGNLLQFSLGALASSKSNREIAVLDILRLGVVSKGNLAADDYTLMADLALGLHNPGDAQNALRVGLQKGVLTEAKVAAKLNKANTDAAGDEHALAAADAAAAKAGTNDRDVSVAEGYFSYGHYADVVRVAQRAITKPGGKRAEAQLLLGMSQACTGDNANAALNLAQVKGDAGLERAAFLWSLYATRKYGAPAAPAAGN